MPKGVYKGKVHHDGVNNIGVRFGRLVTIAFKRILANTKKRTNATYLCKCDCGNEKYIQWQLLASGDVKSCGCLNSEVHRNLLLKPMGVSGFNILFGRYRKSAENRGLSFELTKEEFREFTQMDCHYCGDPPTKLSYQQRMNGAYVYNGLDRIDNTKGYLINNVVSCCEKCNRMKLHHTLEDFENHIAKIYLKFQTKNQQEKNKDVL